VLDVLLAEAEQVRLVETDGKITGYATGTRHGDETTIGPVIAADEAGVPPRFAGVGRKRRVRARGGRAAPGLR
jgi:hypothetical protein